MSSKFVFVSFAVAAQLGFGLSSAHAEAFTTRIEPRPFYGATVTMEEGVRVIRPLPPERQVIINPNNATPLSLGFNETHVYENRVVRNYNYSDGGNASAQPVYGRRAGFYGPGFNFGGNGNRNGPGGRGAAGHMHGGGHH